MIKRVDQKVHESEVGFKSPDMNKQKIIIIIIRTPKICLKIRLKNLNYKIAQQLQGGQLQSNFGF
jgi:hypothetical protein